MRKKWLILTSNSCVLQGIFVACLGVVPPKQLFEAFLNVVNLRMKFQLNFMFNCISFEISNSQISGFLNFCEVLWNYDIETLIKFHEIFISRFSINFDENQ